MTKEEKAKAYDEALKRAKDILFGSTDTSQSVTKEMIEDIFPELAESEDERIRKALLELVHNTTGNELLGDYKLYKEEAIAWLEKQGQEKSIDS